MLNEQGSNSTRAKSVTHGYDDHIQMNDMFDDVLIKTDFDATVYHHPTSPTATKSSSLLPSAVKPTVLVPNGRR